jgi:hypothetical protein
VIGVSAVFGFKEKLTGWLKANSWEIKDQWGDRLWPSEQDKA